MIAVSKLASAPLTIVLAATTLTAFAFPSLGQHLDIDFSDPARIVPHQWFGCHLLHWSSEHLLWDLAMFCLLGGLCERWWPNRFYATVVFSAIAIPLVTMIWRPEIHCYRGLSGIDTALFGLLATALFVDGFRAKDRVQTLLFGGLMASLLVKLAYEFCTGGLLFVTEVNFIPLPAAHLTGALVGSLVALGAILASGLTILGGKRLVNLGQQGGIHS